MFELLDVFKLVGAIFWLVKNVLSFSVVGIGNGTKMLSTMLAGSKVSVPYQYQYKTLR